MPLIIPFGPNAIRWCHRMTFGYKCLSAGKGKITEDFGRGQLSAPPTLLDFAFVYNPFEGYNCFVLCKGYSACFLTLGMRAHMMNMPARSPTITGCKTMTPTLEAMAPVRKGKAADPAWPKLDENPNRKEKCISDGRAKDRYKTAGQPPLGKESRTYLSRQRGDPSAVAS